MSSSFSLLRNQKQNSGAKVKHKSSLNMVVIYGGLSSISCVGNRRPGVKLRINSTNAFIVL